VVHRLFAGPFHPRHRKRGRLRLIRPGADPVSVAGVPAVLHKGHGGLLDVAVDPAFFENGILYLSYLHGSEEQFASSGQGSIRSSNALESIRRLATGLPGVA
jgi:glucose/arabinose dehydrogenase